MTTWNKHRGTFLEKGRWLLFSGRLLFSGFLFSGALLRVPSLGALLKRMCHGFAFLSWPFSGASGGQLAGIVVPVIQTYARRDLRRPACSFLSERVTVSLFSGGLCQAPPVASFQESPLPLVPKYTRRGLRRPACSFSSECVMGLLFSDGLSQAPPAALVGARERSHLIREVFASLEDQRRQLAAQTASGRAFLSC